MLEVKDVYKSYRDHQVLKGASFTALDGQIYGLIGKNGAGKTTLFNIIAGPLSKDSGEINTEGHRIGYLPDLPAFFEYMKAGEYLDFLLMKQGTKRRDDLLNMAGLSPKTVIEKMSRGMRQRLGIVSALATDPDIVLLDEPASALDPQGRSDVMNIMTELKKQNKTVIFSTHILQDMENICDDFGFLNDGIITPRRALAPDNEYTLFVSWTDPVTIEENALPGITVQAVTDRAYRFVIEAGEEKQEEAMNNQKRVLEFVSSQNATLRNITNETLTLDSLFKEVCD